MKTVNKEYYGVSDICTMMSVSRNTAYRMLEDIGNVVQINRKLFVKCEDFDAYMRDHTVKPKKRMEMERD